MTFKHKGNKVTLSTGSLSLTAPPTVMRRPTRNNINDADTVPGEQVSSEVSNE